MTHLAAIDKARCRNGRTGQGQEISQETNGSLRYDMDHIGAAARHEGTVACRRHTMGRYETNRSQREDTNSKSGSAVERKQDRQTNLVAREVQFVELHDELGRAREVEILFAWKMKSNQTRVNWGESRAMQQTRTASRVAEVASVSRNDKWTKQLATCMV